MHQTNADSSMQLFPTHLPGIFAKGRAGAVRVGILSTQTRLLFAKACPKSSGGGTWAR